MAALGSGGPAADAAFPARSGLRKAPPDCGGRRGEREKSLRREEGKGGGATARVTAPAPAAPPQPETQQGPYATAPPGELEKGPGRSGDRDT